MAIFEYVCNKCHTCFSVFQFAADDSPGCCPDCGDTDIQRQISLPSRPIFHGPGFYETDYKQKGK